MHPSYTILLGTRIGGTETRVKTSEYSVSVPAL